MTEMETTTMRAETNNDGDRDDDGDGLVWRRLRWMAAVMDSLAKLCQFCYSV